MTSKKIEANQKSGVLRDPKQKKKLGLSVPNIKLPHEDLFQSHSSDLPERLTSVTSQSSQPSQAAKNKVEPVAPNKNYQKVPNSITKEAIPSGLFKGKSKQLYDVLYALTRGAFAPVRSVRIRKTELMKKANIGSRNTFENNIDHLQNIGLIHETVLTGEHTGNEFEIFTFEELATLPSQSSQPSQPSLTGSSQKLVSLIRAETSQTRQSLNNGENESYEIPKTLLKTSFKIDDEKPLISALEKLNEAAQLATGKDLTQKDLEGFSEIIELIINETTVARTKTGSISVYLKFAAENLRRRLYSKPSQPKGKSERFEPGKHLEKESTSFEPDSLGDLRETILENFRQVVAKNGIESIEFFRGNYTTEDWDWLKSRLG